MKKLLKIAAPIGVLALGIVLVQTMVAAKPEPEKTEDTQRLVSLFVDQVREEMVTLSVDSQGEVKAVTEIDLMPEVSGRIVEISERFAEGAGFNAGDLLVRIDDQDYRLAVTRAEARVAEAEVQLLTQQATADIKRRQWESTGRTHEPNPLQVNKPQVLEAEAKLRSAKADLAEARLNLKRTEIRAPFAGRVMSRAVSLGAYSAPQAVLGRIFATDVVEVTLPLTDRQLAEMNLPMGFVAQGNAAPQVTLSAEVGGEWHSWQGQIVRTHASVDPQTRLIYAVARVLNPYDPGASAPLAVGLFVDAQIEGTEELVASVVPREALRNADQVYVVDADDRLDIRTVKVLSSSESEVLISSGVSVGERVVTSTIASAVDGMLVQPINSADSVANN
ncbi:MAG: efflux RND transporter periplasmic adaptor subunit [Pseudomonadota bacterium]